VFQLAKEAIDNMFFVGIQKVYDLSVKLLLREIHLDKNITVTVKKERDMTTKEMVAKKDKLRNNEQLMDQTRLLNYYDVKLYKYGMFLKMVMCVCDCVANVVLMCSCMCV
jgi:hypothetical protein